MKKIKVTHKLYLREFSTIAANAAEAFYDCEAIVKNEIGGQGTDGITEELCGLMENLVKISTGERLGYENYYIRIEAIDAE